MVAELLIVDDDPAIRRMLGRTLAAEGYEVRVAADGGTALAELERSLPDVLVLDVAMPGIDGLHVAERVRAKGLQLPILSRFSATLPFTPGRISATSRPRFAGLNSEQAHEGTANGL